ncbi:MAG: metal-dependent hydrolase [Halobacteria archaeon]|nr:metal-dependent hydrolase [Halobacteria archaeon]
MRNRGHIGVVYLLSSPLLFFFAPGQVVSPIILALSLVSLQTLPDKDIVLQEYTPISHRGITHTVWFGIFVGVVLGGVSVALSSEYGLGFVYLILASYGAVKTVSHINWRWTRTRRDTFKLFVVALVLISVALYQQGILKNGIDLGIGLSSIEATFVFHFLLGFFGVTTHLIGDVLTPMGIRPLRPIHNEKYRLGWVRAANESANLGLFVGGTLLFVVSTVAVVEGYTIFDML